MGSRLSEHYVRPQEARWSEGFNGNIKTLWQQLDEDGSGQVGLDEIFPGEGQIL